MTARVGIAIAAVAAFVGMAAPRTATAAPQSADERAAARAIVAKRADDVVIVLATLKVRLNIAGREQSTDQAVQANATILDATGLAVMSLQQIQPDEAMSRLYSR